MAMNTVEKKNFVRDHAAQDFINAFNLARADVDKPYTFIVPYEVDGEVMYAKFGITTLATAATKVREAYDVEARTLPAQEGFDNMLAKRAADEAAKAAERAAKKKK